MAPEVQDPYLYADLQEVAHPKTEGEGRDSPDVNRENLPNLECFGIQDAGPDPEAVLQGEDQPKTGGEDKDGPGVKGKTLPKLQHVYMPEQLQVKEDEIKTFRLYFFSFAFQVYFTFGIVL